MQTNNYTRAANSHEDKKQQRGSHQQSPQNFDPAMNYGPNPNGPPNGYYQNPYQPHQMPANGYYHHPQQYQHHPQSYNQNNQVYEMPANNQDFGYQNHNTRAHEMPANEYPKPDSQPHGYQPHRSNGLQPSTYTNRSVSPPSELGISHDTPRRDSPVSSQH